MVSFNCLFVYRSGAQTTGEGRQKEDLSKRYLTYNNLYICLQYVPFPSFHFGVINRTPEDEAEIEKSKRLPSAAAGDSQQLIIDEEPQKDEPLKNVLSTRTDSSSLGGSLMSRASEVTLRSMEVDLGKPSLGFSVLTLSMYRICRHYEDRCPRPEEVYEDYCPVHEHA